MEFVGLDDGVSLLTRLRLEGERSKADIVLGLDNNLIAEAEATGLLAPHGVDLSHLRLPVAWDDPTFVPFDYGWFAFVYNRENLVNPPSSLDELVKAPETQKIIVQDPRTSTPGLGLLLWLRKVYGDGAGAAWQALEPRILTVTKGLERGLRALPRRRGAAGAELHDLALLSPHRRERLPLRSSRVRGRPLPAGGGGGEAPQCPNPDLADRFLAFVVSEGFQRHIPTGNWMFPVIELSGGLPEGFAQPLGAEHTLSFAPREVLEHRKQWIDDWLQAMSR